MLDNNPLDRNNRRYKNSKNNYFSLTFLLNWKFIVILSLVISACSIFWLSDLIISKNILDKHYQELKSEISNLKAESIILESELEYLETDEALELLARQELSWAKPGEIAVRFLVNNTTENCLTTSENIKLKPKQIPNWEKWWNIFWGTN